MGNNPVNNTDPSGLCPQCLAALVETAPQWGPVLLNAGRAAWAATTTFVRTNPGMVAGSIGGASGVAGYYSTTPNPNLRDAGIAGGVGVLQGLGAVYAPGAGTFAQGAVLGGGGDFLTQSITLGLANKPIAENINLVELAGATLGGGAANKLTGAFGPTWSQQASAATIAWPVSTAATAVGQKLGAAPAAPSNAAPASSGSQSLQSFEQLSSPSGAYGGFLLYPNQSNTNMMQSVYGK